MNDLYISYNTYDNFKHQSWFRMDMLFYELQTTTGYDKVWTLMPSTTTSED